VEKVRLARRAGRYARYQQVVQLRQQGMKPQAIAQQLGQSLRAVQRWLAAGAFPEAKKRRKRQSSFDAFAPYILKRWQEGERNGLALWGVPCCVLERLRVHRSQCLCPNRAFQSSS
jgi:hypothetical protein